MTPIIKLLVKSLKIEHLLGGGLGGDRSKL
jgi:hypothetical protein